MCKVVDKQCIAMWGRELSDRISSVSCPAIAPKLLFHMCHMMKCIMLVVYISRNQAANRQKRLTATSQSFLIKNDNLENILCKLASWGWHDSWEGARLFSRSQHGNVHKCSSMVCNYTNAQPLLFTGGFQFQWVTVGWVRRGLYCLFVNRQIANYFWLFLNM